MSRPSAPLLALVTAFKIDESRKILDVRDAEAFQVRRLRRSHNVPHRELKARLFELPQKGRPFSLLVPETGPIWKIWFQEHGFPPQVVFEDSEELWAAAESCDVIEAGPPQQRTLLFAPCPLLSERIELIEASLAGLEPLTCLDVGCGSGRDMIWLGDRGWRCTGVDNWSGAVRRARSAATAFALHHLLSVQRVDIAADGSLRALPPVAVSAAAGVAAGGSSLEALRQERFSLVLNVRFLNRGLTAQLRDWVAPGGYLLFSTFLEDPDAAPETAAKYPKGEVHRLKAGELTKCFGPDQGFETLCDNVYTLDDGRHVSHFLARKHAG